MNDQDSHRGDEEPDLVSWLNGLTDAVDDDGSDTFVRVYRGWDEQEPLLDLAEREGGGRQPKSRARPGSPLGTDGRSWEPPSLVGQNDVLDGSHQEKTERWRSVAAVLVAAALLVAVVTGGYIALRRPSTPTANQPQTTFSFSYPLDGAEVRSSVVLRGTATLPPDRVLWILVREKGGDDPLYYLTTDAPIAVSSGGSWTSRLTLGAGAKDVGQTSVLYAVTSPPDGTLDRDVGRRPDGEYSVRLQAIPADTTVVGQIEVTLVG